MEIPPAEKIDKQVCERRAKRQRREIRGIIKELEEADRWPVEAHINFKATKQQLKAAGYHVSTLTDEHGYHWIRPKEGCSIL